MALLDETRGNLAGGAVTYRFTGRTPGNAAPLGLSAFGLTTFVLSLFLLNTGGVSKPNLALAGAYGYGGLVQLLAGMWEMAVGNTFNATVLSSYAGFWVSIAIILTPGGFEVVESLGGDGVQFYDSFGYFLMAWFIFTFLAMLGTVRSTLAFFLLFLFLDITFLLLGVGYLVRENNQPDSGLIRAGGVFAILTSFLAWYNGFAGLLHHSNSFIDLPLGLFPWSTRTGDRTPEANREHAA